MANLLSLMCGGTFIEKVQAAFILFDDNNSNTLSLDELNSFVRTVFKVLFDLVGKKKNEKGREKELINNISDFDKLCKVTVERCFEDLNLSPSEEVDFH
eukprot:CAMPEP_0170545026 /NCGR_PEP_ID=MMETSP0211-20121228/3569_1 /TAXON_ID=311385 /ORGANISM="Pseudokeronopsis sp., Strain OXSARD2" /LENGTH=98 /DNA_ID=CAMNT_0010848823 /DNA_START=1547 /DNA_END=1843 /DNA_ORIENTATION=-